MKTTGLRHGAARFWPLPSLVLVYLALGALTRLVLWARFGVPSDVDAASIPAMLGTGLVNDAVESLYLFAPLALYLAVLPDTWFQSRWNRRLLLMGTVLTIGALGFLGVSEYYFFDEFDARFNIVAFDYLAYPTEVVGDVWQEYPVLRVLLAATLSGLAIAALIWRLRPAEGARTFTGKHRAAIAAGYAGLLAAAVVAYPTDALSWSSNRVLNELSQNGLSGFFRAATTNEIEYEAYYASGEPHANVDLLRSQLTQADGRFDWVGSESLAREVPANPHGLGRLNVVLVSSESFGAEFSKLHGSRRDLTPNFDRFAQQGLWFSNAYASGTRTVRGLEALTCSFPPIPTVSILRRPGSEGIASWGSVMRELGYHTSFLYGGNGYFDNMNHFYASNGFEVLDRDAIESVRFENVWGVSDEDLFDRALAHFDEVHARGEPFFSIVMTTSNHKPFTFRKGLESLGIPEQGGGRAAGVKYADYALGRFLEQARQHSWFDDTLFVVVADHGARAYGKAEIPLQTYEIPLMIYAPKHLRPRRIDTLTTQIDVAPTTLGLLGVPYRAPFFGEDVLAKPDAKRVALFNHNHDVAIYRDGQLVVLGLHKTVRTYDYDFATHELRRAASPNPELARLAIAYYQTAYDLFRHRRYLPILARDGAQQAAQAVPGPSPAPAPTPSS